MWTRAAEVALVCSATYFLLYEAWWTFQRKKKQFLRTAEIADGVEGLIGNTPLLRIRSLSEATGCQILAKAEFMNPGGSVKDRVALRIIQEGFSSGQLKRGGLVTEGTAGSTGVSLAMLSSAVGCECFIAMPDDAALEKANMLQALGAVVERKKPVSITHPEHFVNVARRAASQREGALFSDQFENLANFKAHLDTGQEIWDQSGGKLDAFVCGSGTGGTIAGVSCSLKAKNKAVKIYLVDPPGSGLYNKVTRGVMFTRQEAEQKRLKNPFDTITEGVGINRVTANFARAQIDGALKCSDQEAVEMAQHLLRNDGLFIGSSSAVNCVGACKLARMMPKGSTIVTLLCDGGQRHLSKFHNVQYLEQQGLLPVSTDNNLDFLEQ